MGVWPFNKLFSLSFFLWQRWSAHGYERRAAGTAPSSTHYWQSPERRATGHCTVASPPTWLGRSPTLPSWCAPTRWWSTCSAASPTHDPPPVLLHPWFCFQMRRRLMNEMRKDKRGRRWPKKDKEQTVAGKPTIHPTSRPSWCILHLSAEGPTRVWEVGRRS